MLLANSKPSVPPFWILSVSFNRNVGFRQDGLGGSW